MKQKLQEELQRQEKVDIIRSVKSPTDWCAPKVAVQKNNSKVKFRINFTKRNESVKREKFHLLNTNLLLTEFDGTTIFSKLDCNNGFKQIVLQEKSQGLTTFNTPYEWYCFKWFTFERSSAVEIFHGDFSFGGILGVICNKYEISW